MEYSYCTMSVKVGRDMIEDAEYFKSDDSLGDIICDDEKKSNTLVKLWWRIERLWRRVRNRIKDIYWDIRYAIQRVHRGYDERDVFSMDVGFIQRYTKILTDYRENHMGYPATMTDEQWTEIIDEMLYHLVETHTTEFFALFSTYLHHLWS